MFICFIYAPRRDNNPASPAATIPGAAWNLTVQQTADDGPFYPVIASATDPDHYRFFAGRVLDAPLISRFPAGHPVTTPAAAGWSFPHGELDGSWLALKFDRHADLLTIAADVFNSQRWFYTCQDGVWYIANSLRYVFGLLPVKPAIEQRAVPYMLRTGYLPHHVTPLQDVCQLEAGRVLTIRAGQGEVTTRAVLPVYRRTENPAAADNQSIAMALIEAVAREVEGLDAVILPLSGGMDSRCLLGCALKVLPPEAITTLTFGHPGSWDFRIGTALAKKIGVRNLPLPFDSRPLADILRDNFAGSEGLYCTLPDYPVKPYSDALPDGAFILSGYLGDPVFGSKEKDESYQRSLTNVDDALLRELHAGAQDVAEAEVQRLLADPDRDPLNIMARWRQHPGATLQEKFDFMNFDSTYVNRTNFALFLARQKAFFLLPMVQRRLLDLAFSLPHAARYHEAAYFSAQKFAFPDLVAYPTKRNFGASLQTPRAATVPGRILMHLAREFDALLGPRLGTILYQHPRYNYAHPREALRSVHRETLLACFDALPALTALDPAALTALRRRYLRHGTLPKSLLRSLLTLHQWLLHYPPNR